MVHEIKMFSATCDGCGYHWENGDGIMAYHEKSQIEDCISDSGWKEDETNHKTYCPNCWDVDEDDNTIFKNKEPQV